MPVRIPKSFLDTSVLVNLLKSDDSRTETAETILLAGGEVSAQVLKEFAKLGRRKLRLSWNEVKDGMAGIRPFCDTVVPLTLLIHEEGVRIANRYGYRIYDSLLIAAAAEAGCTTLYSEDMQHGQKIAPLTITNPFAAKA